MKNDKYVPQFTSEQLLDIFELFLDSVEEYNMYDAYDFLPEVIRFIHLNETDRKKVRLLGATPRAQRTEPSKEL